jgi:hypothetical protein
MPMAMDSENIKGRAYAFGTLSALAPLRRRSLQAVLWFLRTAQPDRIARELSFLHFASWVLVPGDRLQRTASAESPAAKKRAVLLFLSAFNGDWDEYLAAFSRVLALPLNAVWRHCQGWPGAQHLNAFLDYVDDHEVFADAFFNAYGDANAEDIRAALRLCEKLEQFALERSGGDATRFRQGYERLLIELGADLAA